jgi:signal transduction histidine kinase
VVRASQAISSEIVLSSLLERILRVIVQTSGAQRGALLVEQDGQLRAEVALDLPRDRLVVGPEANRETPRLVSEAIVRYALRTGEDVVLPHASNGGAFTDDPYVVAHRSKSILCVAVRHRDHVAGLLFLENDLSAGAFTEGRLAVLRLLVAQAAISFENSLLFEKLKGEVTERTRAEATVRFLANAGTELSESLDDATVHEKLAHLVVPAFADWCLVDVVDDDERAHHVAGVHADPDKRDLMRLLQELPMPARDSDDPVAVVLRSGEPFYAEEVTEEDLVRYVPDDEALRLTLALGVKSGMIVPMTAHGRTLGTIVCIFARGERRYRPSERAVLLELAHRAALAIDNARLFRKANEAVQVREDFLAVASHELHTPLTSLLLTVQLQLRELAPGLPEPTKAAFAVIDRQSRRLSKLVDGLLNVSQIAAGRLSIDLERVDLSALVRDVAERFADEASRARSLVSLRADDAVVGSWDRGRLDQVVSNLLANAIKFGAGEPIDVSVARDGDRALLVVRDRGIGIPPERLPFIFERFERGVSSREYGGLGLGLYIVRSIVDKLGGTVRCESAPGAGTGFLVLLPCELASGNPPDESTTSTADATDADTTGATRSRLAGLK